MLQWVSFLTLFPSPPAPLPQELRAFLATAVPGRSPRPGPGMGPGDPGPGIQGPGLDLRKGMGATGAQQPTLSSPRCLPSPPLPHFTARAVQLRWGLSTSRAGGRQPCWACVLSPEGACSCHPLPCQRQAHVLPTHRAPLSPRQAEAEGPPCQRPGTSLNPHSASTSSLSLRQHIWLSLPPSVLGSL